MAISPKDVLKNFTRDIGLDTEVVDEMEKGIDDFLSNEKNVNQGGQQNGSHSYWYVECHGELRRLERDMLIRRYQEKGWARVDVYRSVERGGQAGTTTICLGTVLEK